MFNDPDVAAAMGYKGRNFAVDSIDIVRWYNRETKVTTGSVMFSEECEGPPGGCCRLADVLPDTASPVTAALVGSRRFAETQKG